MEQLTLKVLYDFCKNALDKGVNLEDVQVYLGNDDELNGIHTGWFLTPVVNKKGVSEDNDYLLDMINEDCHNVEIKKAGILLS